ncbi:MAG: phosphomannomutase/phosphoglucomutase [Rickettsiales bacterium]|nr:phosphomannomutase/phosphoglucomutase [Rickettsiales bacterium]
MQPVHSFDPTIFREYDIRGVVGKTLSPADAYWIARSFAAQVSDQDQPFICVGRDGRFSSPEMMDAICKGVCDQGVNVKNIGLGPTPMLYYASYSLKAAGAIMVTGSHNPPDHNGFKFVLRNGPFYGSDIQALKELKRIPAATKSASVSSYAVQQDYVEKLVAAYDGTRPLSIAWDAGNGATGDVMSALCKALPGKHVLLNEVIDGSFPSHHPDPTVAENLQQLIETVKTQKLDAGIAFDGDGDRIGVVDDEGHILWGDQLLMLYAADVLREHPAATIIADVKASGALFEEIARLGGNALMWKTGHSLIKAKMAETKAKLAGEMSGHIFFADRYYGYDDALYAAVRLVSLLSRSGKKLSDLRKALPVRINTPEIRFPCDDLRKFSVIDEVKARLTKEQADFSAVDGVRVNTPDGWWLLRASNTQPMLVARCEGKDNKGLQGLKDSLRNQLSLSNVALP